VKPPILLVDRIASIAGIRGQESGIRKGTNRRIQQTRKTNMLAALQCAATEIAVAI